MIFVKAELGQLEELQRLMARYELIGGQKVNNEKSDFSYSSNLDKYYVSMLENILGVKSVEYHTRYLGLPIITGRKSRESFRGIEEDGEKVQ